ncbi:hypothetical protein AB7M18_003542 [Pseudomonas viridiflava]
MSEFVEVKTADLVGAALDWAVAQVEKVEGLVIRRGKPAFEMEFDPEASADEFCLKEYKCWLNYSPSTDWSQGGPLIHKHQIEFCANSEENHAMHASLSAWRRYGKSHRTRWSSGQDHLIAGCRAIVASVLGETVSVPKELLS